MCIVSRQACHEAADRIEALEAENARLLLALNYFLLRDPELSIWEYPRNRAEELARAALQEGRGDDN